MSVASAGGKPATTTQLAFVMTICSNYHNVIMSRRRIRIFIAWLRLIVKKTASGSYKILLSVFLRLFRCWQDVINTKERTCQEPRRGLATPGLTLRLRKAFLTVQSKHREPATKLKLSSAEFTPIAGWEPLKHPKRSSFFNHLHKY